MTHTANNLKCKGCLADWLTLYWKGPDGPWCLTCFCDRFQDDGYFDGDDSQRRKDTA